MPSEILFPHLSSTGPAPSYREVVQAYRNILAVRFADGVYRPLVLPYHLYGALLLMIYLCIPHKKHPIVYAARWPVLAVILWFQWKTLWEASSMSMAIAFACGLCSAWGMVWSVTWLVFYRPQWDAKRVQRRWRNGYCLPLILSGGMRSRGESAEWQKKYGMAPRKHEMEEKHAKGEKFPWEVERGNGQLRDRAVVNGHSKTAETNGHTELNGNANREKESSRNDDIANDEDNTEYYWQSYPDNLFERIPWVMDLIMNFRGPGWSWAIPPLPALPPSIKHKLGDMPSSTDSSVGIRRYATRRELFFAQVPQFIMGYFALDVLKVTMMKDPYYVLGPNTYALPPHLANLTPVQLHIVRQILSAAGIVVALDMAFSLMPLTMCLLLGPRIFGLRAEVWYFPSFWGSFSNIMDKGLNGLWGGWWHQTFRFAFAAPTNYLINNGYVKARSTSAKLLALLFAFGVSGFLHTGGSISQPPKTLPFHPPIFFMLQALGILIQMTLFSLFRPQLRSLPKPVRQAGNFLFTLIWMFSTGWWLVDDFSRGGIWLCEPIPISPLRGLGFGVEGDGWWCWEHIGLGWYTGEHWWENGIAL